MPVQKLKPNFSLEQERIEILKQLVPEAVSDGKIDWDTLKEALSEYLEDEDRDAEHFGLMWAGKREARRLASIPSKGTLVPVLGEGIDEATTGNIFIEGDNLEVLKLLQKSYAERVKLIYIDPPYNTGNDFIYKDDFNEPLDEYLKKTGQADEDGKLLTSNPQSSGRFHSNWLNMMYPRLRLARNLLKEDGVIFVSIDDNEIHNLKTLLCEIFGEENFVASVIWQKRTSPDTRATLGAAHDYILVFAKVLEEFKRSFCLLPLSEERTKDYKNLDNDPRGSWASVDLTGQTGHATASQFYEIVTPTGIKYKPPEGRCWAIAENNFKQLILEGKIWFGKDSNSRPRLKKYLSESKGFSPWTWWSNQEVGHNQEATKEVNELLSEGDIFNNPKPTRLIKRILQISSNSSNEDIILDFFSGSSTTAHAVLNLNLEESGNRKFIMVQLPEVTLNKKYPTIAEIGKERIHRVIKTIQKDLQEKFKLAEKPDLGFKVYKLNRSNLKIWKDYEGSDVQVVQQELLNYEERLVEGWTEEKVVTELQLLEGFPLDSKIEQALKFDKNRVLCVTSEHIGYRLLICLDPDLDIKTIQDVRLLEDEDIFICLDNALTDQEKIMLADGCNVKTI